MESNNLISVLEEVIQEELLVILSKKLSTERQMQIVEVLTTLIEMPRYAIFIPNSNDDIIAKFFTESKSLEMKVHDVLLDLFVSINTYFEGSTYPTIEEYGDIINRSLTSIIGSMSIDPSITERIDTNLTTDPINVILYGLHSSIANIYNVINDGNI